MLFFAKLPKAVSDGAPETSEIKTASVTVLMLAVNQCIGEVCGPWLTLIGGCPLTGVQTSFPRGTLYRLLALSLRPVWKNMIGFLGSCLVSTYYPPPGSILLYVFALGSLNLLCLPQNAFILLSLPPTSMPFLQDPA